MSGSRKVLIRLELCNLFGLNVLRHTRDKKTRRKGRAMAALWAVLLALLFFYVGALSYGLVFLGVPEVIPAYLTAIISLVLFFLDIFKAGGVLFRKGGYDILCSLPVSQTDIVLSRLTRMYAENLAVSLAVLLPGLGVSAWLLRPGVAYCLLGVLSAFFLPLAPLAAAALLGALITAMASRMKHKALAEAGLSILLCVVLLLGSSRLAGLEGELSPAMLQELAGTIWTVLGSLYPPAVWFGAAVTGGDLALFGGCAVLFMAVFAAVVAFLSANFHSICRRVHGSSATHDYRLSRQKQSAVLPALCKRELKRYLSSGVYVSNTIIGPIMGTALSAALLFVDLDPLTAALPIDVDVAGLIPFLLGAVFSLMATTAVSVSMEGQNFWIVKSLPLETKTILDAKLLLNLGLMLPFYLLSQLLLLLALRPGALELLWQVLIPGVLLLFSSVFGLTVNLHLPSLRWDSEVAVVKQSASALIGGMGGFLLALLCTVPAALVTGPAAHVLKAALCLVLLGVTGLLYRNNSRFPLEELN